MWFIRKYIRGIIKDYLDEIGKETPELDKVSTHKSVVKSSELKNYTDEKLNTLHPFMRSNTTELTLDVTYESSFGTSERVRIEGIPSIISYCNNPVIDDDIKKIESSGLHCECRDSRNKKRTDYINLTKYNTPIDDKELKRVLTALHEFITVKYPEKMFM